MNDEPDWINPIAAALRDIREAEERLVRDVRRAHEAGHSWTEIGRLLGTSRQAAFKRFATPRDPRTGAAMDPHKTADLIGLTEQVFGALDAGDYDAVRQHMPDEVAAELTREVLLGTWAKAVADAGNLERCADTVLTMPGSLEAVREESVLGTVVGDTRLVCAAGDWRGRVAWDPDARLVGLLILPPEVTDVPF